MIGGQRLIDRHGKLVMKAYEVRKIRSVEELLHSLPHSTARTRKLWGDICSLSRLRIAFEKFKKTALELLSFRKVTISLVPRDAALQNPLKDALNLRQVIELLRLPFNSSTINCVVNRPWSVMKAEQEFAKRQK